MTPTIRNEVTEVSLSLRILYLGPQGTSKLPEISFTAKCVYVSVGRKAIVLNILKGCTTQGSLRTTALKNRTVAIKIKSMLIIINNFDQIVVKFIKIIKI